ncbi:MAG: hypothetical protein AAFQ94_10975, partial [Bacteroidota bacterium]
YNCCQQYLAKHQPDQAISALKFFKRCKCVFYSFREILINPDKIKLWLENVFLPIIYNTVKEAPKGKNISNIILKHFLS